MKYFNILLVLFYIPTSIFGFGRISNYKNRNGNNLIMTNDETINTVLKYKSVLSENTYNSLISKIKTHDIKKIYVTNKFIKYISSRSILVYCVLYL
jgi:hypothetical protein